MPRRSDFQFSNPVLMDLRFTLNEKFDIQQLGDDQSYNIPIQIHASRPDKDEIQGNTAIVAMIVEIGDEGSASPYYMSVKMSSRFTWNSSVSADMVDAMLSRNAPALLLGYIRPLVANITEASPVGACHIPFYNFT